MTFDEVKAAHAANRPVVYKKNSDDDGIEVTVSRAGSPLAIYVQTETDGQGSALIHVTADQLSD